MIEEDPRLHTIHANTVPLFGNELMALVREFGLVVVEGVEVEPAEYRAILQSWGATTDHPFLPTSDESLGFAVLERRKDRVGDFIYGGAWHQNLTFLEEPPDITALYADEVSDPGNFTAFVDLCEVAPWYSKNVLRLLAGTRAVHSTTAPDSPQNAYAESTLRAGASTLVQSSIHPCFVGDSSTRRSWPFVMSNYVVNLDGWRSNEAIPLVRALCEFAHHDEFVIRHYWHPKDLLMWDNRRYIHRATVSHKTGIRRMWRGDVRVGWGIEPVHQP